MVAVLLELAVASAVDAARNGDVRSLRDWLDAGGNPNQYDVEGWTPLLAAAVRGNEEAVALLLDRGADPDMRHRESGALPIHFAGHSGSIAVASKLLAVRPGHLDAIWEMNGHTLLLQAAFYGYVPLAAFAIERGASTAATTVRGLTALDLARQYSNAPMIELLAQHEPSADAKAAWHRALLERIAPMTAPGEEAAQALSDRLVAAIQAGLAHVAENTSMVDDVIANVRDVLRSADVNRLGGPLRQPPLVVVVTGNNGDPPNAAVAELRLRLAELLLDHGADPTRRERHPMGVHAIIRAAVFNHLDILKLIGWTIPTAKLRDALNEIPIVNGLTALHDTVLRASMTSPDKLDGYLEQIRWCVASGAGIDIEDFSGRTQRKIAESTADPERRRLLLEALGAKREKP